MLTELGSPRSFRHRATAIWIILTPSRWAICLAPADRVGFFSPETRRLSSSAGEMFFEVTRARGGGGGAALTPAGAWAGAASAAALLRSVGRVGGVGDGRLSPIEASSAGAGLFSTTGAGAGVAGGTAAG